MTESNLNISFGKSLPESKECKNLLTPKLRRGRVIYDRDGISFKDHDGNWSYVSVRITKPTKDVSILED